MGDWQDIMSMDGDFAPWDSPGWADDVKPRKKPPPAEIKPEFETFQEAMAWSRANPGRVFSRNPNGSGFKVK
jgi:hypothetical protein